MYNLFRSTCERLLRIPHDPLPPPGDESTARVFRAAPAYFKYRLVLWSIGTAASLLFATLILGSASFALVVDRNVPTPVRAIATTIFSLIMLFLLLRALFSLAVLRLEYEKRWYIVTDRSLRVREGVISVREMTVTFANIQNVAVMQGPIQRVLGLADLQVETAGGGSANTNQKQIGPNLHVAWFRGIDNAEEVKVLIHDRLRKLKDAGLGDHDDHASPHAAATPPPGWLEALRAVLEEARALRAASAR
jgi:membrane protein YdbS with pleckstrin-like domain